MDHLEAPSPAVNLYASDPLVRRVVHEQATARALAVCFSDSEAQADIIVTIPVRLGALLQRVRQFSFAAPLVALGAFVFDPGLNILIAPDTEIVLTEKETAILKCLLQARGAFISRRDLLTQVWGYAEGVETHTLETHIYRLRQKLERDPANPEILITAEQGYRLNV